MKDGFDVCSCQSDYFHSRAVESEGGTLFKFSESVVYTDESYPRRLAVRRCLGILEVYEM